MISTNGNTELSVLSILIILCTYYFVTQNTVFIFGNSLFQQVMGPMAVCACRFVILFTRFFLLFLLYSWSADICQFSNYSNSNVLGKTFLLLINFEMSTKEYLLWIQLPGLGNSRVKIPFSSMEISHLKTACWKRTKVRTGIVLMIPVLQKCYLAKQEKIKYGKLLTHLTVYSQLTSTIQKKKTDRLFLYLIWLYMRKKGDVTKVNKKMSHLDNAVMWTVWIMNRQKSLGFASVFV